MKRVAKRLFIVMSFTLFVACASGVPGEAPFQTTAKEMPEVAKTIAPTIEVGNIDLENTEWVLATLNGRTPLAGTNLTLSFSNGNVGGFSGCNYYGGPYQIEGIELKIGGISSNAQECLEPEGVMAQERDFQNLLLSPLLVELREGQLLLKGYDDETTLDFRTQVVYHSDPARLMGGHWVLLSMDNKPLIESTEITLSFEGVQIRGHAGCRDYRGSYSVDPETIKFPFLEMIDATCQLTDSLLEQEGHYTDALTNASHYRLTEDQLEIFTARGEALLFNRSVQ